jgi:hypothetical protein
MMTSWSKGSTIKQHIKLCGADGKGVDCPVENCRKCGYDNDIEGREAIIAKEDLIRANNVYWNVCTRSLELLKAEFPDYDYIDVDEVHVDPEEDYVFVSYSYSNAGNLCSYKGSKTYRINKFLSLVNKEEKVDPNDRIPVELKGTKK